MTATRNRWALTGAGLGLAASIAAATVTFDLPFGSHASAETTQAAAPPPATPVTVTTVEPKRVSTWQDFSGRLEAVGRVQIRPRVAGTIQSVHFREGGLVKAGDLLVTIDPEPYKAVVAQAEGQVASARARLALTKTELDRGEKLAAKQVIPDTDLVQRGSAYQEAEATLQSALATLKSAQLNLDYTEIRAPISGRVGRLEITEGNLVAAGSEAPPLTTLVSMDPIYASFDANEELVGRTLAALTPGADGTPDLGAVPIELGLASDAGTPVHGTLQLVDNEVNAASGTLRLRAVFDNPGWRLIPGQFVRLRMGEPKAEEHLMISERAIGTDQDKKFVYVVGADNTVAYRQVALGAAVEGQRIVTSGLNAGDRIVVNGLQRIRPGALVAPSSEPELAQK